MPEQPNVSVGPVRHLRSLTLLAAVAVLLSLAGPAGALNNGLGLTPPMGWNPWNKFGSRATEAIVKAIADSIVSKGLLAAGYQYLNLDGGGSYPSGQAAMADYVHARGFKFGVYANDNNGIANETQLAATWASRKADYVKYDCFHTPITNPTFVRMREAIAATGRPMFYSIHCSGELSNMTAAARTALADTANMWRTSSDITYDWRSMIWNVSCNNIYPNYAGPGHWNDPDIMEVGTGWTDVENHTHFSLWCMMAAPLLMGHDVRTTGDSTLEILTNEEVIALDQDSLGYQGRVVVPAAWGGESKFILDKILKDGSRAFLFVNNSTLTQTMTLNWAGVLGITTPLTLRDLWQRRDLGVFVDSFTAVDIPSHGCVLLRAEPATGAVDKNLVPVFSRGEGRTAVWKWVAGDRRRVSGSADLVFDLRGRVALPRTLLDVVPSALGSSTGAAPGIVVLKRR